jgi:polyferredoxin
VALLSLLYWGRGLFCGWLCPFGALQEFAHHIAKALHLPQIRVSERWDTRLKWIKYGALAVLIGTAFWPTLNDTLVEVEPFKTSITVGFDREWIYVSYAAFWLLLGLVVFKSFCRYLCPLGAFLALGGLLRRRDWIARRVECGSPCQLCKVRCKYGAIEPSGAVRYDECFQCLDCVTIHDDKTQCVPLILAARRETA